MRRAFVAILVFGLLAGPAGAESKKRCRQACGGLIDTCAATTNALGFGDLRKGCKKAVLKQCKRAGTEACTAFCGDGTAAAGEACDGADLGGATCQSLGFASGTLACTRDCGYDTRDCVPVRLQTPLCGNGHVDAPESCDGADLGGASCASLGFASGNLGCTASCGYDTSACVPHPAPTCGNGTVDGAEQCDGAALAGATCASLGFASGSLGCTTGCGYDTSACVPHPAPTCGNGVAEGDEQCDGADLAGATCTTLGFTLDGTLGCTAGCGFDASGCASQVFPASGQTTTYTADKNNGVAGEAAVPDDGMTQAGWPLDHVDNGDGTITDRATGLMWEKKSDDGGLHDQNNRYGWSGDGTQETIWDWLDDVNAEDGTGFAGHDDWRIPNPKEFESILDYGTAEPIVPALFHTGCTPGCTVLTCSCTLADFYWTSSTYVNDATTAWFIVLNDGAVGRAPKTNTALVRAVRGGFANNRPCADDTECFPNQRCRAGRCKLRRACSDLDPAIGRAACFDFEACIGGLCECGGDCNLDGAIVGSEITVGVQILGGAADLSQCPAADINGDTVVLGNEVSAAIVNLNLGCKQEAQP